MTAPSHVWTRYEKYCEGFQQITPGEKSELIRLFEHGPDVCQRLLLEFLAMVDELKACGRYKGKL